MEVWNKPCGARLSTCVIFGKHGFRCCLLNGAAARTCQLGDAVISVARARARALRLAALPGPRVAVFEKNNRIRERLEYRAGKDTKDRNTFQTVKLRAMRAKRSKS